MNKLKLNPTIEYIEASGKEVQGELDMAFDLLFEEVLKNSKNKGLNTPKVSSTDKQAGNISFMESMHN